MPAYLSSMVDFSVAFTTVGTGKMYVGNTVEIGMGYLWPTTANPEACAVYENGALSWKWSTLSMGATTTLTLSTETNPGSFEVRCVNGKTGSSASTTG